ncbi:MAG TPA: hypothetical protein VJ783_07670 [Pirellulales bacterium]|nr:hypothetical protein [Pirellulales bacterium]
MSHRHRRQRRGAVLIMALVCLVLAVTIGGALLRWVVLEHKLLATRADESQARWLVEAGIERAAARLASDAEYAGEIWEIAADELPAGQAGRVELRIDAIEGQSRQRTITVVAKYPLEVRPPARARKQIIYQLPPEDEP